MINAISVCDGISAASVACEGLSFRFLLHSEIEDFPRSVILQRHGVVDQRVYKPADAAAQRPVLWHDFTAIRPRFLRRLIGHADVDFLFGGTPCQSFSVAGGRAGLDDPRGDLSLEFALLAFRLGCAGFFWENVPGVFSSAGGKDFAAILSAFTGREVEVPADGWSNAGWIPEAEPDHFGIAWRTFDAQYAGVPQRRRRVFVVGHLGDYRRAVASLFDLDSLQGHPAPSRQTGQDITHATAPCLTGSGRRVERTGDTRGQDPVVAVCMATGQGQAEIGIGTTLNCNHEAPIVCHSLRADGFDASEDGTGRGTPLVPVAFRACGQEGFTPSAVSPPITGTDGGGAGTPTVVYPIADMATRHAGTDGSGNFAGKGHGLGIGEPDAPMYTLTKGDFHAVAFNGKSSASQSMNPSALTPALDVGKSDGLYVASGMAVRRLSVVECERLMGQQDGYTAVLLPMSKAGKQRWRTIEDDEAPYLAGHGADVRQRPDGRWETNIAADGPRYKSLGNSWEINTVRWIVERIDYLHRTLDVVSAESEAA